MFEFLERTAYILGEENLQRLATTRVAILGLGGVGGTCAEALCRMGVGHFLLVDNDVVSTSNCNRQLLATSKTIDMAKTEVAKARLLDINPDCHIETANTFYLPEESQFLYDWKPDCVIDAIDTITAKLHLAQVCPEKDILLFASMGTGNRLDPSKIRYGTIDQTSGNGCPVARVMRREMRKRGIESLRVVFSDEVAIKSLVVDSHNGRHSPASTAFVPPVAGYTLAFYMVKTLLDI